MSLRELKNEVIHLIENSDDEKKIKKIRKELKEVDWWDELSAKQKKSIKEAEREIREGKFIPHSQVIKESKKWLTK